MRKALVIQGLAVLTLTLSAQADTLWDNGPFETGLATNGNRISQIQDGYDTFGIVAGGYAAAPQRVADDFIIPAGKKWQLTHTVWHAYQGSVANNPFTKAYVGIFDTDPTGTTNLSPLYGDLNPATATNRLLGQTFTNVYRVSAAAPTGTTRPIQAVSIDLSWVPELTAGHYWIAVGLAGTTDTATVAVVPVTPGPVGANGLSWGRTRYSPPGREDFWQYADGAIPTGGDPNSLEPYDHAFQIHGTPEPATVSLLALAGLIGLRRRR
ncbi:MAG: PEP-CTERM sorting domain-containing protein [Phycisphaerae bacterium]